MLFSDQNIRHVFEEGFCARDIAQALRSFDAEAPLPQAAAAMQQHACRVAGVRTDGVVTGYILADALAGERCGDCQRPFNPQQFVSDALPLAQLVQRLDADPCCFVIVWEQVGGYVERLDLQKPPGRMWLFGMVTLIEMRFGRLIEEHCQEAEWKACLSPGRIEKAEALRDVRLRCGQRITLANCLQFADLARIVSRLDRLRQHTRFESKKEIERMGSQLEKLRNNLAHSQDIVGADWETIVLLAKNLSAILDGPRPGGSSSAAG